MRLTNVLVFFILPNMGKTLLIKIAKDDLTVDILATERNGAVPINKHFSKRQATGGVTEFDIVLKRHAGIEFFLVSPVVNLGNTDVVNLFGPFLDEFGSFLMIKIEFEKVQNNFWFV